MSDVRRAWSTLEIKAVDSEQGYIEGVASTPSTDRMGDIVEPKGAQFKLPIPLLWQHDAEQPIGQVMSAKVTDAGIAIRAQIARNVLPRIEEAWALIKSGLVRGLSIGFRASEMEPINPKDPFGGMRFLAWEWLELSAVTIPANQDASITVIKSIDESLRAASGEQPKREVVTLQTPPRQASTSKGKAMVTLQEQSKAFEAKRAANVGKMDEMLAKAGEEGRTLEAAEQEEFDTLEREVKEIDAHLTRVRSALERAKVAAQPVPPTPAPGMEIKPKHGEFVIRNNANLPKGMGFARYVKAVAAAKGNLHMAQEYAKQWDGSTPEVGLAIKAAVNAGTTTDSTFASSLVYNQNLVSEFVDYLRPKMVIGRMDGFRRVPFNVRYPTQTAGSTVAWVGEGNAKPLSELTLSSGSLGIAKASGVVVITQELARSSAPSAEETVRNDLTDQMVQFLDQQFLDPSVAAVANTNPASVLNGASNIVTATGNWTAVATIDADIKSLISTFDSNEIGLDQNAYWVMKPGDATALGMLRTTNGPMAYPDINNQGGMLFGIPVLTSNSVPSSVSGGSIVALIKASEVFLADEGGLTIDVSEQASVQMSDSPSNSAASVISFWQSGLIGIKIDRFINWSRRRTYGVGYVEAVHT